MFLRVTIASVLVFVALNAALAGEAGWGGVDFNISCNEQARRSFDLGMAMFYSFSFAQAVHEFETATKEDPRCAMPEWGIAVSKMGSLYGGRIRPEAFRDGREALDRARSLPEKSERENDFIHAAASFYEVAPSESYRARLQAYAEALDRLRRKYPHNLNAAVLYAYAETALALPGDLTYRHQLKGARILEEWSRRAPQHPGVLHYLIHAYDYTPLAARGIEAAGRFTKAAPNAPHARQFPAHVYVRLGLWQPAIQASRLGMEVTDPFFKLHAMDFLVYALLQAGEDEEASRILRQVEEMRDVPVHQLIVAYALAALPARYAIERRDWTTAARLELPVPNFPWGKFPQAEAALVFARGLGAAHSGDFDGARSALARLHELRGAVERDREQGTFRRYWIDQVRSDAEALHASIMMAKGQSEDALPLFRNAAEMQEASERDPVVPGPIAPARELLGDALLSLDRPAAALQEFEVSLLSDPSRFRSMYGVAESLQKLGRIHEARIAFARLLGQSSKRSRAELVAAEAALVSPSPPDGNPP